MSDTVKITLDKNVWTALPDVTEFICTNKTDLDVLVVVKSTVPTDADLESAHMLYPEYAFSRLSTGVHYVLAPQGGVLAFTEDDR